MCTQLTGNTKCVYKCYFAVADGKTYVCSLHVYIFLTKQVIASVSTIFEDFVTVRLCKTLKGHQACAQNNCAIYRTVTFTKRK